MGGLRLFTPHRDNCDTTEVFVEVYTDDNSVQFGFCIDKDEHSSGAKQWEEARDICVSEGKRLPEPGEYKFACNNATGLNNMTDDWEFASNFARSWRDSFGGNVTGAVTVAAGNGGCPRLTQPLVANALGGKDTMVFRCVR